MNNQEKSTIKKNLTVLAITFLMYMTYLLLSVLAIMLFTGTIHILIGQGGSSVATLISKCIAAGMGVISVVYFLKIWRKIYQYAENLVYRRGSKQ